MPKNKARNLRKELESYKSQAQKYKKIIKALLETLSEELLWDETQINEINHLIESKLGPECRLQLRGKASR